MDRRGLQRALDAAGIHPDAYELDGGLPNEAYTLEQRAGGWAAYYSERGLRTSEAVYGTEAEACADLHQRLLRDQTALRQTSEQHASRWRWRRRRA